MELYVQVAILKYYLIWENQVESCIGQLRYCVTKLISVSKSTLEFSVFLRNVNGVLAEP